MKDAALAEFERLFEPEFGHGKRFDLAPLQATLAALGSPHERLPPTIHVAGTNGKGSTIAFMRAIGEAAGLRVHAFTKPHLLGLAERFLLAGAPVGGDALIEAARRVGAVGADLTQFDAQVAAAFLLFAQTPADLCLIETGMGGRDDSTNVLAHPRACVLTPIGLDHQDALGDTLEAIASHKAGILKPGAPAAIARQPDAARLVIEARAAEIGAPLYRQGVEWDAFTQAGRLAVQTETRMLDLDLPALTGPHQIDNAGLAVAALLTADIVPLADAEISRGLRSARWAGRLQPIARGPLAEAAGGGEVWVDGGHNAHAAAALVRALEGMQQARPARTALVVGMRARKDWRAFVDALAPAAHCFIGVPVAEGVAPAALAERARQHGADAHVAEALRQAIKQASAAGAGRILVCGSLLLAAEAQREA